MVLKCLTKSGKMKEASQQLRRLIPSDPEEWSNYLALLDVAKTTGGGPETYVDCSQWVGSPDTNHHGIAYHAFSRTHVGRHRGHVVVI